MQRHFISINEPVADFKWQKLFFERWPAYQKWLNESGRPPERSIALAALRKYMPEMVDTHDHLCRLVRAEDDVVAFLTGFQPPAYSSACSQVVSTQQTVQLIRNYDYHVGLFEGTLLMTRWHGKKVIANSDCLLGVLDGMNEDGLAISLTFGGRSVVGYGFGIPFILRYILEFCSTVEEAVDVLLRVPSHMSYNVTVTDRRGLIKTIQIAPDKSPVVTGIPLATNHQGPIEWAGNINKTVERASCLKNLLLNGVGGEDLTQAFLRKPLHNSEYSDGFGTLYTAVYQPIEGKVQLHWPNESVVQSFDSFIEGKKLIIYNQNKTSIARGKH
ncbi:MAG: C45 family peptidase [Cyclobacteriaceae bacterium]